MCQPTDDTLLIGDFYAGAYGPTIILILEPERGAHWFHGLLTLLATAEGNLVDLVAAPETEIEGIDSFKLGLANEQPEVALRRVESNPGSVDFEWIQSTSGWTTAAALIETFVQGGSGHHYLSLERHDAALVEVSFKEDIPSAKSFGGSDAPVVDISEAQQRQAEP